MISLSVGPGDSASAPLLDPISVRSCGWPAEMRFLASDQALQLMMGSPLTDSVVRILHDQLHDGPVPPGFAYLCLRLLRTLG